MLDVINSCNEFGAIVWCSIIMYERIIGLSGCLAPVLGKEVIDSR